MAYIHNEYTKYQIDPLFDPFLVDFQALLPYSATLLPNNPQKV